MKLVKLKVLDYKVSGDGVEVMDIDEKSAAFDGKLM